MSRKEKLEREIKALGADINKLITTIHEKGHRKGLKDYLFNLIKKDKEKRRELEKLKSTRKPKKPRTTRRK